jgi:excisionase family DNA binding protein
MLSARTSVRPEAGGMSNTRDDVQGRTRSPEAGGRGRLPEQIQCVEDLPLEDILELIGKLARAAARCRILTSPHPAWHEGSQKVAPALMTVSEVAAVLKFSRGHVYELVRRGELAAVRCGRTVRIRQQDLEAWQSRHQTTGVDSARPGPTSSRAARAR